MNDTQKLQLLIQAAKYMVNVVNNNGPTFTAAGDLAITLARVMTREQHAQWRKERTNGQ